jgi:hypothetical protein
MVMDKVIDESFLKSDVTEFALGYDRVKNHTWYDNLNYLVDLSKEYFNDYWENRPSKDIEAARNNKTTRVVVN